MLNREYVIKGLVDEYGLSAADAAWAVDDPECRDVALMMLVGSISSIRARLKLTAALNRLREDANEAP